MEGKKYKQLLKDKNVQRWYDNLARGALTTADVYLRRMGTFCDVTKTTPKKLSTINEKDAHNIMLDFVSYYERKGRAGSYINSILKTVRSWLLFNNISVKQKIKVKGSNTRPTLKDKQVPDQEKLRQIFLSGNKQKRTASALIALSGLREEVLGNYKGVDGLRVSDFPEMELKSDETIFFNKIPTMIIVRPELSKKNHQYFTFLGEEGCEYLKSYLEARMNEDEEITPESPIITPKRRSKPFIRTTNISDLIRGAIRNAGYNNRPYDLRNYFDMQLMQAESKGLVIRDYRVFWMGHVGDIENTYTTNRQNLPTHIIEDMRDAYKRSQSYLQTAKMTDTSNDLKQELRKEFLTIMGFNEDDIDELNSSELSKDEFIELLRKKRDNVLNSTNKQKVVDTSSVGSYLQDGWEFVTELSNHKSIICAIH